MRITGILLAAGAGVRFGGGKLLAQLPDGTILGARSAANLIAVLPEVIAVVRPGDDALARVLAETGARVTICADSHTGMGASLAHGVREAMGVAANPANETVHKATGPDACVVALADMPWISAATIHSVAGCLRRGEQLVVPRYRGRRGHPVGFGASHLDALLASSGDEGAKAIIESAANTVWIDVDDPGVLRDVDLKADLAGR